MSAIVKEVAKRAGLSSATVSRILNGKGGHSSETVKTVEKIVAEMGFSSNHYSTTPDCVGIVMLIYKDFMVQDYTSTLLTGILETLTAEGMIAQIIPVTPSRLSLGYIQDIIKKFSLKGLIVQELAQMHDLSLSIEKLEIPKVFIGNMPSIPANNVRTDSFKAGRDAASYLWSMGHRNIGIISGHQGDYGHKNRIEGFFSIIRENGGDSESIWMKSYDDIDLSVTSAVSELVNMPVRPTAILSLNSTLTLKFLMELRRMGLCVPDDISLISFEESNELENLETPVTSIHQPTKKLGKVSVRMLINLIQGRDVSPELLECSLTPRKSTMKLNS